MSVADLLRKKRELLELKNKEEGKEYLKNFSAKEDVITLVSGIAYEILSVGTGVNASLSDKVECHYHGTNIRGEVFDSSIERGLPAVFNLSKLILAYQEVVPLLPMGTKFRMVTPPEYAYRDENKSKEIGPYSTLIFEVELISIR
ncbi:FKBP-type peptidyl-prolyl cis-trans isomerase [Myroides sp. N17-2]|uniref:FKBP-type peptidyl-prolyl cis-trans isomerase n=1 Tax=Myroides sp. N17-2 TaxID=2030799 RepID=UPI000EFB95F5|nr:FKBP-type peptidyl-prolyl cis-trans isomerase [Myroides sp. N17-2]